MLRNSQVFKSLREGFIAAVPAVGGMGVMGEDPLRGRRAAALQRACGSNAPCAGSAREMLDIIDSVDYLSEHTNARARQALFYSSQRRKGYERNPIRGIQ